MNRKLFTLIYIVLSMFSVTGYTQTFTFSVDDTLLTYSFGDTIYSFHGHCENLLPETRTLVFTLTPVQYPDTNRQSAVCTFVGCYPPRSGEIVIEQEYEPNQIDSGLSFYVYNTIVDWSQGFPYPVQSPINGNYELNLSIHSAANPQEVISYRLHLESTNGGIVVRSEPIADQFELLSNYPNPFNSQTKIQFTLLKEQWITLSVYDMAGRLVNQLYNNTNLPSGTYSLDWSADQTNGAIIPSGTYFLRLQTHEFSRTHKILYIR